jgi:predicted O-methyltransferase YrrM
MDKLRKVREEVLAMSQDIEQWQNPIGPKTASFLFNLIIKMEAQIVMEIGTSAGYSGLWLAEALIQTGGHLWTLESNQKRYDIGSDNFSRAGVKHIVTNLKGHAPEVLDLMPNEVDIAFFDATKRETISFLVATWPKLKAKAKIVIDNVDSHIEKMQEFIDYLDAHKYDYERIHIEAGLIVIHKNN